MERPAREVFKPRKVLGVLMGAATALWAAVLFLLMQYEEVPPLSLFGAVFFIAFFGVYGLYYARTAIEIDAGGLTYRGVVGTKHLDYDDIHNVDVLPGLVTVYAVRGRAARVHFTSAFAGHQHLAELLVRRSHLAPYS